MTKRRFSDEELAAFLDGEADDALTEAVEAQLAVDTALAQSLEGMRAATDAFKADQEAVLSLAPAMPAVPVQQNSGFMWPAAFGGLAAGLVIAAGISWAALSKPEPDWRAVVANYQSLYVTETLAGVAEPQSVSDAKLAELSEVLGIDLQALPQVGGLAYRRAQQLGYKGTPLAQLTFLTDDGGPVALCLLHVGGPDSDGIEAQVLDGLSAYSWTDNGFGVLLIGPLGNERLEGAAKAFRSALQSAQT